MIRFILLTAIVAAASTASVISTVGDYPRGLASLFGPHKKAGRANAKHTMHHAMRHAAKEDADEATKEVAKKERTVCNTKQCQMMAKVILESMDASLDPCEDFYEYACGKWAENNPVPDDEESWSLWRMVQNNINKNIKDILAEAGKPDDILAVRMAKKWYNVCKNTERMEEAGLEPILSILSRIGGWPLIMEPEEWDENAYTWQKVDDYYARLTGANSLHDLHVASFSFVENGSLIWIATPHLPPGAYDLIYLDDYDEIDTDDTSDEEKQSREDSQEPLSKERGDKNDDKNDDKDDDKNDDKNDDKDDDKDDQEEEKENDDKDNEESEDKDKVASRKSRRRHSRRRMKHPKKAEKMSKTKKNHAHGSKGRERTKREARFQSVVSKSRGYYKWQENLAKRKQIEQRATMRRRKQRKMIEEEEMRSTTERSTTEGRTTEESSSEESSTESSESRYKNVEEYREIYRKYVMNVALELAKAKGERISEEKLAKDVDDMVEFYYKLAKMTVAYTSIDQSTLVDFQKMYDELHHETKNSKINWVKKVVKLFTEMGVEVDSDIEINYETQYFEDLRTLLDETKAETIVNYIHWRFVSNMIKASTKKMRDLYDGWEQRDEEEQEEESKEDASKRCVNEMQMSDIVAYEYVRKYFTDEMKTTAMDMIDDIQKEVEYQIKESQWMDSETKDFVLDKLVNMKKLVGYPDWYRNTTLVKRYFRGLVVGPSYLENILSFLRYQKWKKLQRLTDEIDDESFYVSPVMLNAFFIPDENSITITAADFQHPFFSFNRPQGINFGILGFVMAHEVNHGFDDTGHFYDKDGDFMEWLSAMAQAYDKRAECFVKQFDSYSLTKDGNVTIAHYGNQTSGENIADTMGLQAVYRAYRRRERECDKVDSALPGLEQFDGDQLFFLSFANLWCEAQNPDEVLSDAKYDSHSTGRLRVIGSVSNSQDFAKAYNCPVGSPMNPERKCNIWK